MVANLTTTVLQTQMHQLRPRRPMSQVTQHSPAVLAATITQKLSHASLPEDLLCIKGYADPRVAKTACGILTLSVLCRTATGIGSTSRRPEVCPVRHRYVLGLRAGHAKLCASCNPGDEDRVEEKWTHEYERYRSNHVDFVS